ncbi:MAG: rRNA biogenesis protein rrp36 [Claussenomyces sp. TS43310]|nr:MAG: rRNA biogenesis protein rrp36 [Claussenomyces sp. TS43310]
MSTVKRKILVTKLNRRVRARRDPSPEIEEFSEKGAHDSGADEGARSGSEDEEVEVTTDENEQPSEGSRDSSEDSGPEEAASVSFGALAKAQAAIERGQKRSSLGGKSANDDGWEDNEAKERKEGRKDHRDFNRSSKHAPTEISSKKAVSRKREVIPILKRDVRDPRFDPLSGPVDELKLRKAYSFLDDYRENEMRELKTSIKKSKDEGEQEKLKRALLSMESRKKAQERRRREEEILSRHKKEEKELVKQGKNPFYLKNAEKKKRVLLDQYSQLKGSQLDRVIERRRKKVEGKEKKKMPYKRREV